MKINFIWTDTDEEGFLDECDDILGPDTTILDMKGLIKMWTEESIPHQILVFRGAVCENGTTLRDLGIVTQADADEYRFSLILESEEDSNNTTEFSHEDFIRARKAQGYTVPVTKKTVHEEEVRREALAQKHKARHRPAKLQEPQTTEKPDGCEDTSEVYQIYQDCKYGVRREGVEERLAIQTGPTKESAYDFWDLRLPENMPVRKQCDRASEMVIEIFYFGDLDKVTEPDYFKSCVAKALYSRLDVNIECMDLPLRDAGCMYPLIALHCKISHEDATALGNSVFEHFGTPLKPRHGAGKTGGGAGKSEGGVCGTQ